LKHRATLYRASRSRQGEMTSTMCR
jgi:hypothetical protein